MANQYCKMLSNSYRFMAKYGSFQYQPCCWVPYTSPVISKQHLKKVQSEMTENILDNKETACKECNLRDQTNFRVSGRQRANELVPDDAVDGDAYILEIQLDTECNAACSICGPHFSSLWRKQLDTNNKDHHTVNHLYEKLPDLVSFEKLTKIYFAGGEPLLNELHLDILKLVPHPENIELIYSSNGSVIPSLEVFDMWSKFQKVIIHFSIDDIEDRFTYTRWPLKWRRINQVLAEFKLIAPNVKRIVHCTLTPMNIWYLPELDAWINETNVIDDAVYSPCYGNLGLELTPLALRQDLTNRLPKDHAALKLINAYTLSEDIQPMLNYLDLVDKIRNSSWREIFPDIVHYFK